MELLHLLITFVALATLFVYDLRYMEIPDWVVIPFALWLGIYNSVFAPYSLSSVLLAVAVGMGFFGIQYAVSRGRWIGSADILVGGIMGLLLGWPLVVVALLLAYVLGGAVAVVLLLLKKRTRKDRLPLASFLCAASFIVFVAKPLVLPLVTWYVTMFRSIFLL